MQTITDFDGLLWVMVAGFVVWLVPFCLVYKVLFERNNYGISGAIGGAIYWGLGIYDAVVYLWYGPGIFVGAQGIAISEAPSDLVTALVGIWGGAALMCIIMTSWNLANRERKATSPQ